jgi:hypothetical protein
MRDAPNVELRRQTARSSVEKDLINSSLHSLCILNAKSITEVAQYLKMKYRLDIDETVLNKRLNNILYEEKAVA